MRRTTISWSYRARRDLLDIGDFIARDKPEAATRWVGQIIDAIERAAVFPTAGRVVPEAGRDDVREIILDHYRIVYQTRGNEIIVLTIFEGHKLLSGSVIERERPGQR